MELNKVSPNLGYRQLQKLHIAVKWQQYNDKIIVCNNVNIEVSVKKLILKLISNMIRDQIHIKIDLYQFNNITDNCLIN